MASAQWNADTYRYYNQRPYWETTTAERRSGHMSSGSSRTHHGEQGSGASGTSGSSGSSNSQSDTGKSK
jgi:hypothetical protein